MSDIPVSATVVQHQARVTPNPNDCSTFGKDSGDYNGQNNPACETGVAKCIDQNGASIWSHQACVAAATCQGTKSLITQAQCNNHNVAEATAILNLSYAVSRARARIQNDPKIPVNRIYTNIVGSRANSASGCPITQQNYIDFIYGATSAAGVTEWTPSWRGLTLATPFRTPTLTIGCTTPTHK
ncbi:hypothetical protein B0H10DRAFT_2221510 [Mycena sp. CBHHK59/15]|nr:hypothetical protein B0H10DRAFT_2221510 [Mycena sp. CBHHK59/15]